MIVRRIRTLTGLAAGALVLGTVAACGGAGGDGVDVADGGIRGTGSSVGPVSGFGSVFVNGVKFDTENIGDKVQSNDGITTSADPEAADSVQKGMILQVTGRWAKDALNPSGVAETLTYDDTFRGPLTADPVQDATGKITQIEVLDQQIKITGRTVFSGFGAMPLADKTKVRVSAWYDGNEYRASHVGLVDVNYADPDRYVEVEGAISDVTDGGFKIGKRSFTYLTQVKNGIVYSDDLSEEFIQQLQNGDRVEVEGDLDDQVGTVLIKEIGKTDDNANVFGAGKDLELSGPLLLVDGGAMTFSLNGVRLELTDTTEFDGFDRGRDQLQSGLLVEVEGTVSASGDRLLVEEIERLELADSASSEVEGRFKQFNSNENTLIVITDDKPPVEVTVIVNNRTLVDFEDSGYKSLFELNSASQNIELEVEGIPRDGGTIEALYIEVEIDD